MKLIVLPIAVTFAGSMLTNVNFSAAWQPIVIGWTLAISGHLLEWALLSKNTFLLSLILDFVTAAVVIYFSSYFFFAADVTFLGAVITALFLTLLEFFVHIWLVRSGRSRKELKLG